jgi:DeoR/GlpR family transcriptional regulator of sugar metabolism
MFNGWTRSGRSKTRIDVDGTARNLPMAETKLYAKERLTRIMEILRRESKVSVEALAQQFDVSGVTIRADLRELELRHLIMRTHGGALLKETIEESLREDRDPSYARRVTENIQRKEAIGRAAAALLRDGDSVMLDDGSTTLQVAHSLPLDRKLQIITNGVNICLELLENPSVEVIATGGTLNRVDLSYTGKVAEDTVRRFFANKAILGASGISLTQGITAPDQQKAELKKTMMAHSHELIIVADSSKLARVTLVQIATIEKVHTIVTDTGAPADFVKSLRDTGVTVVLADS